MRIVVLGAGLIGVASAWFLAADGHEVIVVDPTHPVTAGLKDFRIVDETYKYQWIDPHAHLLLATDDSTSDRPLAWSRTYRNARVCYIQLGHGLSAYNDAGFRKIVVQAIRWAAKV